LEIDTRRHAGDKAHKEEGAGFRNGDGNEFIAAKRSVGRSSGHERKE
jgi:hypothetical protein